MRSRALMAHEAAMDEITNMVAHLTLAVCHPGRWDDAAQAYRGCILPIARRAAGYRGMYLLVDQSSMRMVAISLWDTLDDARAYEQSAAYQSQFAALQTSLAGTVRVESL